MSEKFDETAYINDITSKLSAFKLNDAENIYVIKDNPSGKKRALIHEASKLLGLFSETKTESNTTNKFIEIKKNGQQKEVKLDNAYIELFCQYTSISIPVALPEYFEYYMEIFDKYYNARNQHKIFDVEIRKYQYIGQFKTYISDIQSTIVKYLKEHPEFCKFTQITKYMEKNVKKCNLYTQNNKNKWFISVDIKSANFTVMKKFCKGLFDIDGIEPTTWNDFLKKFTDSKFVHGSKHIREVIFGNLGVCNRVALLCPEFINNVHKFVTSKEYSKYVKMYSSYNDELIYEVDNESANEFKDNDFIKLFNDINNEYPNTFHVKMFKLVQLGNISHYVREFTDNTADFKECPKKFMPQCIKFYEGKEITETDRKFVDEGCVATYDSKKEFY
jgi:hypothetical protein